MYRVLLVDDEDLDLEGLTRFIPWESLQMEVVASVNNAISAWDLIQRVELDILITDIRMPKMSGLELARMAQEKHKDIRVVFVSGYEDFQYAKEALQLNASCYLLKPVDDDEMTRELRKLKSQLDMERNRRRTEHAYKEAVPLLRQDLLLRLLEGKTPETDLLSRLEEHGVRPNGGQIRVAVIEIDDVSWKLNACPDPDKKRTIDEWSQSMIRLCREQRMELLCQVAPTRIAVILDGESGESASVLEAVAEQARRAMPFTVTIGLSRDVAQPLQVGVAYQQAVQALESKMFVGKGQVIPIGEIRQHDLRLAVDLDLKLDDLLTAIANYELVDVHDQIGALFAYVQQFHSRPTSYHFAMYLIVKLDEYLRTLGEDLFGMLGIQLTHLDIVLQFETLDDIQTWFRRNVYTLSEMLHRKKQKKNLKLVQQIVDYIHEHIDEVITLRNASDHFHFTPNYLGHIFKEETGIGFTDYVSRTRLDKARDLLRDSNMKVYEIADRVGYRNLNYFSRQFKDYCGMSPLDFRRSSERGRTAP